MVEDLTELDAVRQIDDLLEFKDNRIKTFTNFLNISPKKEEKKRLSLRSKSNICKNPFIKNDIQSEELSFIIEDNIDEGFKKIKIIYKIYENQIS